MKCKKTGTSLPSDQSLRVNDDAIVNEFGAMGTKF